jgi:hypothetical protein
MKQAAEVLRLEKETAEKLAAKAFAKSYLADLVPSVFNNLRENGYFYDAVERDLEVGLMPWLLEETLTQLDEHMLGRYLLDSLIRNVVNKREDEYAILEKQIKERNKRQVAIQLSSAPQDANTLIQNDDDTDANKDFENGSDNLSAPQTNEIIVNEEENIPVRNIEQNKNKN